MSWLIIGSVAAYHWFPDYREPHDLDLLTPAGITSSDLSECFVDAQWHDAAKLVMTYSVDKVFADPNVLFTLKVSHANWDIKWKKTMWDIGFLKKKGCTLILPLHEELTKVWKVVHGKKRVNMRQSRETFWKDAVVRIYDHEDLHTLVAFYDRPLHETIRPDPETVWCSVETFNSLDPEVQYELCLEEMMATAIERSRLTPESSRIDKLQAMSNAYFKLCTSMTTGWFARHLILNQKELLHERKEKWMNKLNSALSNLSSLPVLTPANG